MQLLEVILRDSVIHFLLYVHIISSLKVMANVD
jgi:hypothetical protein